ncbi:MAG: hypothetical protein QOI66_5127 [Myxococcales bacterium]|nr:hypothetical protein [Myxococcales bacterium]
MKNKWLPSSAGFAALLAIGVGCTGDIGPNAGGPPGSMPTPPGGGGAGGTTVDPMNIGDPAAGQLRRLNAAQFGRSLQDLLHGSAATPAVVEDFPANSGLKAIGASTNSVTQLGVEQYETAINAAVDAAFADPARRMAIVGCAPAAWDDACAQMFLQNFGTSAWRRPLAADELARYMKLGQDETAAGATFADATKAMASALLQSPNFLYRVELGSAPLAGKNFSHYTGYETATRLSFLFWSTTPDTQLLSAAKSGSLDAPAGIAKEAQRLLSSPRAVDGLDELIDDVMGLDAVFLMAKDPKVYPQLTPTLRQAMRTEVLKMFEDVALTRDGDMMEVFDTNKTFVNQELGKLYGITATGTDFTAVQHAAEQPRAGLLTTAAILTVQDKVYQTSPTRRGAFVRRVLTCDHIPDPPAGVNTNIDPPAGGAPISRKQLLSSHVKDASCAVCHTMMDPVGLAFENFDGMSVYRTKDENGLAIDPSGMMDGKSFAGARELGTLLRQSTKARDCLTRNVYRFAMGHVENSYDDAQINKLSASFAAGGQKFKTLVMNMISGDGFMNVLPTKN